MRLRASNTLNKNGLTLVEVLVASAVFAIGYGALLVGQKISSERAEQSLVYYTVTQYVSGFLELLESYPYEDEAYVHTNDTLSDASLAFSQHDAAFGTYQSSSGIYDSSDALKEKLPSTALSLRYQPTSVNASSTALDPFVRGAIQANTLLLGPEEDDKHVDSDIGVGFYKITEKQQALNLFSKDMAKYFFMDDVDDFDGYREIYYIWPDVPVTIEVSVTVVYDNFDDFTQSRIGNTGADFTATIPQARLDTMVPISVANLQSIDATLANPAINFQEILGFGYSYYNIAIFKKITIKASWVFPRNSTNLNELVIDGGVIRE